jgi:spore maturation protein CgeB
MLPRLLSRRCYLGVVVSAQWFSWTHQCSLHAFCLAVFVHQKLTPAHLPIFMVYACTSVMLLKAYVHNYYRSTEIKNMCAGVLGAGRAISCSVV